MRVVLSGLSILVLLVLSFNFGLDVGLRNKPEFDTAEYHEVDCNDIEPFEYGVKCIVHMEAEDSNVRIYKGEGSRDDFGRVQN